MEKVKELNSGDDSPEYFGQNAVEPSKSGFQRPTRYASFQEFIETVKSPVIRITEPLKEGLS